MQGVPVACVADWWQATQAKDQHPSPAIRQQRELGEALRHSLDQLGGRIGRANS